MRAVLLAALTLIGCERERSTAEDCNGAAAAMVKAFEAPDAKPPADARKRLSEHCASDRWTATAIACIQHARAAEGVDDCNYKQLTQQQADLVRPIIESIDPFADEALVKLQSFWDRACACTSPTCAGTVMEEMAKWSQDLQRRRRSPPRVSDEKRKQFTAISKQIMKCTQRANGDDPAK